MRFRYLLLFAFLLPLIITNLSRGQQQPTTGESSLDTGSTPGASTNIGGYGNALFQHDANAETGRLNLERFVLFVGHRFSNRISFFSELEVEDAKVEGGEPGGEVALEQAYLRFSLSRDISLVAGLFIPRIGIINEDHLPNSFNGNERPLVETFVIPSTWRELGVGLYGTTGRIPLQYTIAVVNGLNSAGFEQGTGIREGRFEGRNASANNLAVTGSLRYQMGNLELQASGYAGGTVGLPRATADTLLLTSGAFGTPVVLGEAHARYERDGMQARLLGTIVSIPDAASINDAYANNTPEQMFGAYVEVGYDILSTFRSEPADPQLVTFLRLERFDLNSKMPSNAARDASLNQTHLIGGFSYLPHPNVIIKADVRLVNTGGPKSFTTPGTELSTIDTRNTFINLGIGFSF